MAQRGAGIEDGTRTARVVALAVAVLAAAAPAGAQSLEAGIAGAPDGAVRFHFPAEPGVCGHDDAIMVRRPGGGVSFMRSHGHGWSRDDLEYDCIHGPIHVLVEKDGRTLRTLDVRVGAPVSASGADLGAVPAQEAADWLLDSVRRMPARAARDAIMVAGLGRDVVVWRRLLGLAQDAALEREVRKSALFWLGQEAGEAVAPAIEGVARATDQDVELRKHAVFALSQREPDEAVPALARIALDENVHGEVRKRALFWLAQHDDPRVLALFERILSGR